MDTCERIGHAWELVSETDGVRVYVCATCGAETWEDDDTE